jgi:DNA-binding MarR family transcriptional regulator
MSRYIKNPIKDCMNPQLQPLTPVESYCLMVLAGANARAYEIAQLVQFDIDGRMRISPSTASQALKRMEELGWVEQSNPSSAGRREGRVPEIDLDVMIGI